MKKFTIIFAMAVIFFTGCGMRGTAYVYPLASNDTPHRVIIDQIGREVALPEGPLTLGMSRRTAIFLAINAGALDNIVNVGGFATGSMLCDAVPQLRENAVATGLNSHVNIEELANVMPDVFLVSIGDMHAILDEIEMLGIATVVIDPEDFDKILETLEIIGYLAGTEEHVQEVIAAFNQNMDLVAQRVAQAQRTPTAIVLGNAPLAVHPPSMLQTHLVEAAGGFNLAYQLEGNFFVDVNIEEILSWNPEYIFITAFGGLQPEDILEDPRFAPVQAVLDGNVFKFPSVADWWDTPSAAVSLGVMWATHKMHPDLISFEELEAAVAHMYSLTFGGHFGMDYFGF
ncbi:MAG: ABC transporter substrate-binding protein [Defluviitaleaceae bacterium]|nr:ABC transporter substrate-binding protein [Defluviitaleaceae bacterium]